jgi:hypothetical protein
MQKITPRALSQGLRLAVVSTALVWAAAAQAQFSMVPAPQVAGSSRESPAETDREYKLDAARHIYAAYPMRVFRGKLPPMLYGIAFVETEIDATGQVVNVNIVRKPAAPEVGPWVQAMIKRAAPFPVPAKMAGNTVKFTEFWLVDKSGLFQVDSLTEGQR